MDRYRHPGKSGWVALAALAFIASMQPGSVAAFDHVLEGAYGDRVTILLAREPRVNGTPVTLCLLDRTADDRPKGFDIRQNLAPRFWIEPRSLGTSEAQSHTPQTCGAISDTAHTVSFFTRSGMIHVREVLRAPLDLGGLSGRRVDLIWTLEGL